MTETAVERPDEAATATSGAPAGTEGSHWVAVAGDVAVRLAADAVEREQAGAAPVAEVELLRGSGLPSLLVPTGNGGAGQPLATAHQVIRTIGAADASIGHLLGYHYLQLWRLGLYDRPELQQELESATTRHRWFWSGVSNPRDASLELVPEGDGFRLRGRKSFATGASVADRLVVSAWRPDTGEKATFVVPARAAGVEHRDDWDNLGQRRSASGGIAFHDVPVPASHVLSLYHPDDPARAPAPPSSLAALGFQLVLTQLYVAIAEGALATAADYTRTVTRPWPASGVDEATDDPYVLATYGDLAAQVAAAAALTDRAAQVFDAAAGSGPALTPELRGAASAAISTAKVIATRTSLEVTTRIFEVTGARATAARHGLDRFWRNARTLTLHDPVDYKAREVGQHYLTGKLPPVTDYS